MYTLESASMNQGACVLIVEDDVEIASVIQKLLAGAGYVADIAHNARQAHELLAVNAGAYRLMTLDILLPGDDGVKLLHKLRAHPDTHDLPVVVLSAKVDEAKRQINGGAVGILDWLYKPIDEQRLLDVVNQAVSNERRPRILHVEDEYDVHQVVSLMLRTRCEVVWTTTLNASRRILQNEQFDLVLLDIALPDGSGLELLADIERCRKPPRVVIFSAQDLTREYADKVSAVLVKSKASNEELLEIMLQTMQDE
jgi:DNA-binding response OmpR family regulator